MKVFQKAFKTSDTGQVSLFFTDLSKKRIDNATGNDNLLLRSPNRFGQYRSTTFLLIVLVHFPKNKIAIHLR